MPVKKILVTGAGGFVGRNLVAALNRLEDIEVFEYDLSNSPADLASYLKEASFIYHLAGVNRPERIEEFLEGNAGFTTHLVGELEKLGKSVPLVYTSSTQAELDNPYGESKREAEKILRAYAARQSSPLYIYRLPNVFGKWSRPNYNSAVATFCHHISRNLEITISNRSNCINLVYIDDVIASFLGRLSMQSLPQVNEYCLIEPEFTITLGELTDKIYSFREIRKNSLLPDFSDKFTRYLYSTYLSFLDEKDFSYSLDMKTDNRGMLFEWIKSGSYGQIFVSTTKPGITRGNHYHHSKVEKFCVIKGEAEIKFREINSTRVIVYPVSGENILVVDIPPGYTHSITNIGESELVTLFWANEIFDPQNPETYYLEVENE